MLANYRTAQVLGHGFGPDLRQPAYTYLKGNAASFSHQPPVGQALWPAKSLNPQEAGESACPTTRQKLAALT